MSSDLKKRLSGERIVLIKNRPTFENARVIFKTIEENREHLEPWIPRIKKTKKPEDCLKNLLDKERKSQKKKKADYGIYLNKEYIGNISLFNIDKKNRTAELGYWLSASFVRNGYMTEAVAILEKEAFEKLQLNRIEIRCDQENLSSSKVAKKCGYCYEGKLRQNSFNEDSGKFKDIIIFSKLRSEYIDPDTKPDPS